MRGFACPDKFAKHRFIILKLPHTFLWHLAYLVKKPKKFPTKTISVQGLIAPETGSYFDISRFNA